MKEVAYGAIDYFFCEASAEDFYTHYHGDDNNHFITDVLMDAIIVSAHHQIRPEIKDIIIDIALSSIDPTSIIQITDGIFNYNQEVGLPSAQIRRWLEQDAEYAYTIYSDDVATEIPPPDSRSDLFSRLENCSRQDFYKIIRFLRVHDEIADNLDFSTIEIIVRRLDCILQNDQLFFSLLTNSVLFTLAAKEYPEIDNEWS